MSSDLPLVSIVIPTQNRAARLIRALDGLARQEVPEGTFDVVVVADGCTDGTAGVTRAWPAPFPLRVIEQAALGPAAARNRGAAEARGPYLLFLDDDVLAKPGLVRAHLAAHQAEGRRVVIGYLPPRVRGRGFFPVILRGWWEAMFEPMRRTGHRFTFRDLLSGNFSLERELFERVGRFEEALRCHEDYELGVRLLEGDAVFHFEAAAEGVHDEQTDLSGALARKFAEGRADVWLAHRHPALLPALPLTYLPTGTGRRRALWRLAFRRPAAGDLLAAWLRRRLRWYEQVRLRYRWKALLEDLLVYQYLRGVASLIDAHAFEELQQRAGRDVGARITMGLDLRDGLQAAECRLDAERPAGVRLRYGPHPVGDIPADPGAERLRGAHLRPALALPLASPFLRALALAGELPPFIDAARVVASIPPPRRSGPGPDFVAQAADACGLRP
jgi:glycosyltransferase involved in cell wall biosynthesis